MLDGKIKFIYPVSPNFKFSLCAPTLQILPLKLLPRYVRHTFH